MDAPDAAPVSTSYLGLRCREVITGSLLFATVLFAASSLAADETTGTASATVIAPVSITAVLPGPGLLNFGAFAGDATLATFVTINPDGGGSRVGTASLFPADPGHPAFFNVDGAIGLDVVLTLPGNGEVALSRVGGGAPDMNLRDWASSPDGVIGPISFPFSVQVGATADIAAGQAAGTYTGTFTIQANYN